eukprot:6172106-Alexandrium_andersonii.AAC.1
MATIAPTHKQPGQRMRNPTPQRVQRENAAHAEPPVLEAAWDQRTNTFGNDVFAIISDGVLGWPADLAT